MKGTYRDHPRFLAPLDEVEIDNDFSVLTDRKTVRNLAKNLSNALCHPVTVLDINRLGMVPSGKLRIESDIEYFSLRSTCQLFRLCAGSEKCHECDAFHAALFMGYSDDTQVRIDRSIYDTPSFFYDDYHRRSPTVLSFSQRSVLVYYCPILGYRELMFPILFEGKAVGVLLAGQIVVHEAEEKAIRNEIAESFFAKPENQPEVIFANFIDEYKDNPDFVNTQPENIKDQIVTADELGKPLDKFLRLRHSKEAASVRQANMTALTSEEYELFIACVITELDKLEKYLEADLRERQKKYFETITREAIQSFFEWQRYCEKHDRSDKHAQRREELEQAWNGFHAASEMIKDKLDLDEVLLFGDGVWLNVEETKKKMLYPRPEMEDERSEWEYDFTIVGDKQPTEYDFICSLESPDVLNGLRSNINTSDVILLVYPDVAVLLRTKDVNCNFQLYAEMANAIGRCFSRIRSAVALCAANLMKERHVLTLRMNRHENAHISTRLNDNMQRYFARDGRVFLELSQEKRKSVAGDIQNTIRLISNMATSVGLVIGSENSSTIKGRAQSLDVFDLMNKWRTMLREQLSERNLDIIISRAHGSNLPFFADKNSVDAPRYITTYPDLFELLVCNLLDNAIKYAHRGSIIYLAWRSPRDGSGSSELTVSSFGPMMEHGGRPYELYARGDTSHLHAVEGDGIGLYVVKRAEKLLNLSVAHSSIFVSPYHVPLVKWFIREEFSDPVQKNMQEQLRVYVEDQHAFIWQDVVNEHRSTCISRQLLSKEYMKSRIDRETWLTTFAVTVSATMI